MSSKNDLSKNGTILKPSQLGKAFVIADNLCGHFLVWFLTVVLEDIEVEENYIVLFQSHA